MDPIQAFLDISARQHGALLRADLERVGLSRGSIRGLARRGIIVPVGHRTLRVAGTPPTESQATMLACLDTGGSASARTAARLHGIGTYARPRRPEVLVTRAEGNYRTTIASLHTTKWLPTDDLTVVDGIPTLSVARTLFALAALVPEITADSLTGAFESAIAAGKAREQWLWWHLERVRRRGRRGVAAFEAVLDARSSGTITESWLERETLRIVRNAGLPEPICQARVAVEGAFAARVDFAYPWLRVVIEVSGYRWHRSREQLNDDLRRRRALTLGGFTVLEFSYDDIVRRPEQVVAEITAVLASRPAA